MNYRKYLLLDSVYLGDAVRMALGMPPEMPANSPRDRGRYNSMLKQYGEAFVAAYSKDRGVVIRLDKTTERIKVNFVAWVVFIQEQGLVLPTELQAEYERLTQKRGVAAPPPQA